MKLKVLYLVILVGIVIFTGCIKPTCNKPYILVGNECCLDEDDNKICDKDEVTITTTTMKPIMTSTTTTIIGPKTTLKITTTSITEVFSNLPYTPERPPSGAKLLDKVNSEGYSAEFKWYKFKVDYLIYSGEYEISGIALDVQKPDGTVFETIMRWDICANDFYDARVDDIVIRLWFADESAAVSRAKIYVWDFKENPTMKEKPKRELPNPNAQLLHGLSSESYAIQYKGYKFKIDHLIYGGEYMVLGMLLDVQKPDGTVVQVDVAKNANGKVDNLEIFAYFCGEIREVAAEAIGEIYVWET